MIRALHLMAAVLIAMLSAGTLYGEDASDDLSTHRNCTACGMDRKAYGFSRMLIKYEDGGEAGVCSLHCSLTEQMEQRGRTVRSLHVADRDSQELVQAEQAFWVSGGRKRGVMTRNPVWAFRTTAAADAFIAAYGGVRATWAEVLAAASREVTDDRR